MSEATVAQTLPVWDLSDLYPAPESQALQADLTQAEASARAFKERYMGKLASGPAGTLGDAISEYERIEEILSRVMSYAQLLFSSDNSDPIYGQFYQTMSERVTEIGSHLIFFALELNRIDDALLEQRRSTDPGFEKYEPWLRDLRVFRPHQLSDEVEELLHDKDVTGQSAWSRLFDETIAAMRIDVSGHPLTVNAALEKLSDPERSVRQTAGEAIGAAFLERIRLFSLITNTKAKDKEIDDRWRKYPSPGSYRNRSNMVEDEVVDALVTAVVDAYPRLSHRYYTMKAKWLGLPKLAYYDRNAPLPGDDDRKIGWTEARDRVLSAYGAFSPDLRRIGEQFFDKPWIDVPPREGKAGGAFSHPTVPSAHPYLLLNYHGRTRDVMTLAHELGHGVHQVLAGRQGYLMASTPLTLAETASVFGEMLTFRSLLESATPAQRRFMLTSKVEDMLNTVVRQIAFYRFETKVHDERRAGELLPDRIGEIWRSVQAESLGPAFEFTPDYDVYWAYVPHFVHSPFYVYAYAFGDCLVNALYSVFQSGHRGFQAKYLDMLRAGGTKRHKELLAPFGLDASDPAFWTKGLDVISGFIDELEAST
jgi:oligoendopeptidase F